MTRLITSVALVAGVIFATASPAAFAQTKSPASVTSAVLSESTIKALQDALNKQGIAVKADGVLNDETRAAIRKYQSQHHLPVTGEADAATLTKLGVAASQSATPAPAQSTAPGSAQAQSGQAPPAQAQSGQMPGAMMMNCPMMQGQMQEMMQMMQRMQGMMQMMQGQMQSGQMQPGQMQPGQMQPGQMQRGTTGSEPAKPN
jgi:lysozyme family protein